jgi:hypothetical protein
MMYACLPRLSHALASRLPYFEVAAEFLRLQEYHVGLIKNGMLSLQKNIWKTFNNIAALFPNNRHACMVEDWTKTTHKGIDHK